MQVVVIGAGVIGICSAWELAKRGHEVTVIERQSGAAQETSFANAGQISISYCEPWANKNAPLKLLQWMFRHDAPLLFRPQLDWQQWRWGLRFLRECNDRAFARNVSQLVSLGTFSHEALKDIITETGINYQRIEKGIAHYFCDEKSFDGASQAAELMRGFGVERKILTTAELLAIEPAFQSFSDRIVGATYTKSDESGNCQLFSELLADKAKQAGVQFLYNATLTKAEIIGAELHSLHLKNTITGQSSTLFSDAAIVCAGSYSAPILRTLGVDLPIYPGKGYSASLRLLRPDAAPLVSTIDDHVKCAITKLGKENNSFLRVAGTIEMAGFDTSLSSKLAKLRCKMLLDRIEVVLPGVADTRSAEDGGAPNFWTGLRPATPTNIPYIGKTKIKKLWVNAGHGTLGWTHAAGSGKAIAQLISGETPGIADHKDKTLNFRFYGFD